MTPKNEDKSRWTELAITTAVSAITSAFAVSWSLSSALTEFRTKLDQHDREIIGIEARVTAGDNHAGESDTKIAVLEAHYNAIDKSLDEIKGYLKPSESRQRR